MCNDCYLNVISKSNEDNKDIHCPYCRNKLQNLEEVDLSLQIKHNLHSIQMKNCKLHGKCIYYYLNKRIMESIEYVNGKKHGYYITYYTNEKIYKVMNYKKDKLDGEYKEYDINKKLIKLENYKNGEKDGLCIGFEELTYFDVVLMYHLKKTYNYVNGILLNKK